MLQKEKDAAIGGFYILGVLICGYGVTGGTPASEERRKRVKQLLSLNTPK
jgi:hypothetical protein